MLTIHYCCEMGHKGEWRSSTVQNSKKLINIKIASCMALSGIRLSSKLLGLPTIQKSTHWEYMSRFLYPVIWKNNTAMRKRTIADLVKSGDFIVVCGDAQFDSPGHCGKFCTYTIMTCDGSKVIDFFIIQKGQLYEGDMEKNACQELLTTLTENDNLNIKSFVTDRHKDIRPMMRIRFPWIFHAFDIWHVAKSLGKKLAKAGLKNPLIKAWTRSITNHFWYACGACVGDPKLLKEIFHSCLFHVLDIHDWEHRKKVHAAFKELSKNKNGNYTLYPTKPTLIGRCQHGPITIGEHRSTQYSTLT